MKHPRPRFVTVASPYARSRGVRPNGRLKTVHVPPLPPNPGELLDASYRTLLDASSSAILLLSPESIILGWNRAAETISGWSAHEVLGVRYVDRYVPVEARAAFLAALARVTEGGEVRGCEFPLMGRTGFQTRLSWNMTQVVGPVREHIGTHGDRNRRRLRDRAGRGTPACAGSSSERGSPGAERGGRGTAQNCPGVAR